MTDPQRLKTGRRPESVQSLRQSDAWVASSINRSINRAFVMGSASSVIGWDGQVDRSPVPITVSTPWYGVEGWIGWFRRNQRVAVSSLNQR
ncbi:MULTISPECIES: hypothetical protein [unclassified Actinoplanes]|uniref:hypothetical protein n=1 Tax=unclassified Actinoplanes TaxID=2626549 RepID=UPI0012BB19C8|nr:MULTISPECIES: hypothetical protein [unclassified Actinoplanes]